jgi:hypothetical protein
MKRARKIDGDNANFNAIRHEIEDKCGRRSTERQEQLDQKTLLNRIQALEGEKFDLRGKKSCS